MVGDLMPNIVPGVIWQPVNVGNRAARRKGRGLVGHVAVSSSKNLVPNPAAGKDWHFYLPKVGPAYQYIDLDVQCWSTGAGNASLAAFESEGGLGTLAHVNAEPWNENQLNWAARVLRYLHETEGVPLRVMASSASSERGFGTHRLGVPGYMLPGTEKWSSGEKLCPGDAKHAQRFEVVRRATAGTDVEDDMFTDADRNTLKRLEKDPGPGYGPDRMRDIYQTQVKQTAQITGLTAAVDKLADAVAANGNDPDLADKLKAAVREAMAEGAVRVDVTVQDRTDTAS